jgi:hypothetical protein
MRLDEHHRRGCEILWLLLGLVGCKPAEPETWYLTTFGPAGYSSIGPYTSLEKCVSSGYRLLPKTVYIGCSPKERLSDVDHK